MIPIATFAPDLNPLTPGIMVGDTDGVYPAESGGVKPVPALSAYTDALAAACKGAFSYQETDTNFRTIAGTATKLYELNDVTWTDVSKAGDYSSAFRWRFAAWGSYCLATNGTDAVQVQSTTLNDFADLAGSPPKAKFVSTMQNFVFLANVTDDGSSNVYGNRVHWSAQGDHTDWTPSLSTQCGYIDLSDTPGDVVGLGRLGDYIVVFKENCLYLGTYVGPPFIWSFRRIAGFCGAKSQESIIELEDGLYYPGSDDFYVFDGGTPRRVGKGVRYWFFNLLNRTYEGNILGAYDWVRRLIFWWFPTGATGDCNDCLIYDIQSNRWGRVQQTVEAALIHYAPDVTYDTVVNFYATYDAINIIYDAEFWSSSQLTASAIGSDHKLSRYSGTPGTTVIYTGDIGELKQYQRLTNVWPYFSTEPTTCTVTARKKVKMGGTATNTSASTVGTSGKADLIASAKFISLILTMTGDYELLGYDPVTGPVSQR